MQRKIVENIHKVSSNASSLFYHNLVPHPIASDPTEQEGLVVLESKFAPIICQAIVTPKALPGQLVASCALLRPGAKSKLHFPHVLWNHTIGFYMYVSFDFGGWIISWTAETPSAAKSIFHDAVGKERARGIGAHIFFCEVVDHIDGFGGGEEGDASAVAEEAEVAEVGYNEDGRAPS